MEATRIVKGQIPFWKPLPGQNTRPALAYNETIFEIDGVT